MAVTLSAIFGRRTIAEMPTKAAVAQLSLVNFLRCASMFMK